MIKLRQAVIVEGKYDKITLGNIVDATIITTNGFGIFKDKESCEYIRRLSAERGIIVITDSDSAGAMIRAHIKNICGEDRNIINVYIPQLSGKEKRKDKPSKEGFLGVEGMTAEVLKEALRRSGVTECQSDDKRKITKNDLFTLGLSGCKYSKEFRTALCAFLKLPSNLSSNAFLDAINTLYGYEDFFEAVKKWQRETDKN